MSAMSMIRLKNSAAELNSSYMRSSIKAVLFYPKKADAVLWKAACPESYRIKKVNIQATVVFP